MRDPGSVHDYPPSVRLGIDQDDPEQYRNAAKFINREGFDLVCLQHEFGIFGGEAGRLILDFIAALKVPLVTTLHTVLDRPSDDQREVTEAIVAASRRLVVMARKGRHILVETYRADPGKIDVIPHGIPDAPFVDTLGAKHRLGFSGRNVILTFGLISPNKGIETMIEAMPAIIARSPDALYVVMGATHPQLLREAGEAYRESLVRQVEALGLKDHVVFLNRFVDRPELLDHIAMCDLYVTPYLDEAQMTSGTLAYSHGLGRPVVSTPYWHAAELLEDGSGVLVPFGDPASLGRAVAGLLEDVSARLDMAKKAYAASRPMIWANTAKRYVQCFGAARRALPTSQLADVLPPEHLLTANCMLPAASARHLVDMCDDTGMFQHAVFSIPDRHHGYCIDDNARGLLLCCTPENGLDEPFAEAMSQRFAAFVQHAWNTDERRFRNFMGFSRQWLESVGSEDSHGRTLWALGTCARYASDSTRAAWAQRLFCEALESALSFTSPRAWAFTLLGLDHYCATCPQDRNADTRRGELGQRLERLLIATETRGWTWFEDRLTYDNARLCEALIRTGKATKINHFTEAGLRSLRWLIRVQTAPQGHFRPVGSMGFTRKRTTPRLFDQQPLEACATIAACVAANAIDPAAPWPDEARRAFAWFLGENDLAIALVDIESGSCRDGLHPDRANENRGAESVLSYLLGLADMHVLEGMTRSDTVSIGHSPEPSVCLDRDDA